jgi:hypothetical protein
MRFTAHVHRIFLVALLAVVCIGLFHLANAYAVCQWGCMDSALRSDFYVWVPDYSLAFRVDSGALELMTIGSYDGSQCGNSGTASGPYWLDIDAPDCEYYDELAQMHIPPSGMDPDGTGWGEPGCTYCD